MKKPQHERPLVVSTAGFNLKDQLRVTLGPAKCGTIQDGVVFEHMQSPGRGDGCWLISLADLERIVEAAKAARG